MKLIIAITGATGAIFGIRILEALKDKKEIETHLIISKWGKVTIETETTYTVDSLILMADCYYSEDNLAAAISSGSFKCDGMIVAPCTMKTLAGIANGYTEDLIIRAADVTIKEKRKLILMVRETPLNAIHLENMLKLCNMGVIIAPPVPAFYTKPNSLDDLINQTVGRILDNFHIELDTLKRWNGL
ncbi:UbiX family flavin prenyltransferase [Geosporobacter ferrireducens]|uniref:Flavin prenyltransferase UbiX n=1 Tax=Geosporobacter ferrireducens TaxID=1424294 RepID=A0A1D8GM94_9FIRM|nr:UbiX family flavin prenyltransferase [Geosporobacter ferrireducens]AOT72039.1 aromatic acid decarboxylase [Geosporobacter ferrireducens]MTI55921.1 UbiX family flavin prenyltransferase [Geosporobacter ferrireducens]